MATNQHQGWQVAYVLSIGLSQSLCTPQSVLLHTTTEQLTVAVESAQGEARQQRCM